MCVRILVHMTKHHPKFRTTINEQREQPKPQDKGWYCVAHSLRWPCNICGHENKKIREIKYYFDSGPS
jgi:hypothetical protein